jgi:predicted acetyltransferase
MEIPHYSRELKVRPARPDDAERVGRITSQAFRTYALDWNKVETTLVGETPHGKLVSSLNLSPAPLWFGRGQIDAAAIGAVATDAEERQQGYAGALMVGALRHLREKGWLLTPLWPFSFAYYRKFGWELPARDIKMTVWPDMVRRLPGDPAAVSPAEPGDLEGIQRSYSAFALTTNCQTVRPLEWWRKRVADDKEFLQNCLIHRDQHGEIDGYASYQVHGRGMSQGKRIEVRELASTRLTALTDLLRGIADVPGAVDIEVLLPGDSLLPELFPDRVRLELAERLQFRVNDVSRALAGLPAPPDVTAAVEYKVWDWTVHETAPIAVRVEMADGELSVEEGAHNDAIECEVATFSRLFCGGMRVARAKALGKVSGGSPAMDAASDALLFGRQPYRSWLEPG